MPDGDQDEAYRSRFVVGIDLGTTNSALSYVDTTLSPWQIETFRIPQWVDVGLFESRETLPSFHYQFTASERASKEWRLPWQVDPQASCVGIYARDSGLRHPGRRISSAKSWLAHDGVDRSADLLPWHGELDIDRMSPVAASAKYLLHLREAWDNVHAQDPLHEQDVVITLPASFDEVARELTIQAARSAGLARIYLIEEPQAAFYSWIDAHNEGWQNQIKPGQLILVCDIGGGTSDFTLIRVQGAGVRGEQVQFHRVAVGAHLILGGDNLDLALAKYAETKHVTATSGGSLASDQWDRLLQVARVAKETMLMEPRPEQYTLHLPSTGSSLIAGSIQVSLSRDEVDQTLVDGFFPVTSWDERPIVGESGFREFGLLYAADPAITRHLAAFLSDHRRTGIADADDLAEDRPTWVLFNGGVMAAPALRERIITCLSKWFTRPDEIEWSPQILSAERLDLAVARGAAYFGMVRRGEGTHIAANLGRSYYIQIAPVENAQVKAVCLIPGNAEAGQQFEASDHPLQLQIGQPVQFPLWSSRTRLADHSGQLLSLVTSEAVPLPPIYTSLSEGKKRDTKSIRVTIQSELSEIGTVAMWCVDIDSSRRWRLEFDIRSTLQTDRLAHDSTGEAAGVMDDETIANCQRAIMQVFSDLATLAPSKLVAQLQHDIGVHRDAWPPTLLRRLWQSLMECESFRKLSPQHEQRWLNLLGYLLRPGYGVAVDDWRVAQTWKTLHGKLAFSQTQSRVEALILWRRIAGGLTQGQQQQLLPALMSLLLGKAGRADAGELLESWRLAAALERTSSSEKELLGNRALVALNRNKTETIRPVLLWALGRLGCREPVYGPLNTVVHRSAVERWLTELCALPGENTVCLAMLQLARRTNDRHRDINPVVQANVLNYLKQHHAPEHFIQLVHEGGKLSGDEEASVFGEALPLGIRLAAASDS